MLATRTEKILKFIVEHYIGDAVPVSSHQVADKARLGVSSATIRNEVAALEEAGYILRPHTSAGSVPSDKGYRHYVDSLDNLNLPASQQRMLSHLFHQVEKETEKWLGLAATILSQTAQSMAVVTVPKPAGCKYRHIELVSLQDYLALLILVLWGARVKQKLVSFDEPVTQLRLDAISHRLNTDLAGMTQPGIQANELALVPLEEKIVSAVRDIMEAEDEREEEEPYLDGLHLIFNQPEFAQSNQLKKVLEMVEQRHLLKFIVPGDLGQGQVHVIIGRENKAEGMENLSVIISRYGIPDEAVGSIGVLGPTRMPYESLIPSVYYISQLLSGLMAGLYGKEPHLDNDQSGN